MGGALHIAAVSGAHEAATPTPAPGAANDADPFEDYRRRGSMRCPHCRHIANRRTSVEVTPLVWDVYFQCSHPGCSHSFKAQLSYSYGLSPSACPNPDFADLLIRPMSRDVVVKPDPPPPDDPNQPRLF